MVQIVDQGPSGISRLLERASPAVQSVIDRLLQKKEDKSLKKRDIDLEGIRDPNVRQRLLGSQLDVQAAQKKSKLQQDISAQEQQNKSRLLAEQLDQIPDSVISPREKELLKLSILGKAASGPVSQLLKPPPAEKAKPQSPFEKARGTASAKKYGEAEEQISKAQSSFQNISRMRELAKELKGPIGTAKGFFGTQKAAEFDALGLAGIEPVLKIFNPVGAIPTQKINLIKSQFAPKATDLNTTIQGKLNALERIAKQAEERATNLVNLYDKYDGNPPSQEMRKFSEQSERILDDLVAKERKKLSKKKKGDEVEEEEFKEVILITPEGRPIRAKTQEELDRFLSLEATPI